jgi:hypothetical protein
MATDRLRDAPSKLHAGGRADGRAEGERTGAQSERERTRMHASSILLPLNPLTPVRFFFVSCMHR